MSNVTGGKAMRKLMIAGVAMLLLAGCTTVTYNCNVAGSCIGEDPKAAAKAD